jgi:hypothetical protein
VYAVPAALMAVWVLNVLGFAVLVVTFPIPDVRHPAIIWTAHVALGLWFVAAVRMLTLPGDLWGTTTPAYALASGAWFLGALAFVFHVFVAFELAHGWSHATAAGHVERASGFGMGLYVSYLFTLVWVADAAWLTGWSRSYERRPKWVRWAVHGFLAFVTFNATVVYAVTPMRWVWLGLFMVLVAVLVRRRTAEIS